MPYKNYALFLLSLFCISVGCAAVQEFIALKKVNFSLDRVSDVRLAGIELKGVTSYRDLGIMDVARLTQAITSGSLPLDFQLHVLAENPSDNKVTARLVGLNWTLFLEDRETISGSIANNLTLEPWVPQDIPLGINLDLVDFFDGNARDLAEMAMALSGSGGASKKVTLKATPTIDTAIGPITYPEPITIISRQVGQ